MTDDSGLRVKLRKIPLEGKIQPEAGVKLLRAEGERFHPLILVRYELDSEEPTYGLRFDIGKEIFLDRLENPKQQEALEDMARPLAKYLASVLYV